MKLKLMGPILIKILRNNVSGICLFPCGIYFRKMEYFNHLIRVNHESIHWVQQKGMFFLGLLISLIVISLMIFTQNFNFYLLPLLLIFPFSFFYIWYFIEWIIRLFTNRLNAYRNISFEREAYKNHYNLNYLKTNRYFSWIKYIFKTNP